MVPGTIIVDAGNFRVYLFGFVGLRHELRFGISDGYMHTLEDIGKRFNITRERIRQIEAIALRKLQHPMRVRKLEGFFNSVLTN